MYLKQAIHPKDAAVLYGVMAKGIAKTRLATGVAIAVATLPIVALGAFVSYMGGREVATEAVKSM
jgi:hypothetical protein